MRFTKFLAATMTAMTIMSCSEQIDEFGANIQPGDAVLSFKVGTNGGTTYATSEDETNVNSLIAYLKYTTELGADGFKELRGTKDGLTTTLLDGTYTAGPATLYFVGNMPAITGVATEDELLRRTDDKLIYAVNADGKSLTLHSTGMTATRKVLINLQSGPVTGGTPDGGASFTDGRVSLKRLAARVYAESANAATPEDIKDYTVDIAGSQDGATLFSYLGDGGAQALEQYTISGSGTGQYRGGEAVGYVYPSTTDVVITVTNPAGVSKNVVFRPESNRNYKLLITPAKNGAELNFTVTIGEYDEEGGLEADFTIETLKVKAGATLPAGFTPGADGELVIGKAVGTLDAGVKILFSDLFDGKAATLEGFEVISTLALPQIYKISADKMFAVGDFDEDGLNFVALTNPGKDKSYTTTFIAWDGANENSKRTYSINIVVKGQNLPENFTTKLGDLEIMSVGLQADLATTIALVEEINKLAGSNFSEKTLTYIKSMPIVDRTNANSIKIKGETYTGAAAKAGIATICPGGFTLPSLAQLNSLFGPLPAINGKIPLASGDNAIGTITLKWFDGDELPHYTVNDGAGNTLFVPGETNMTTSIVNGASVNRIIFWNSEFQYAAASTNLKNTTMRCIKAEQTLLSY